MIRESIEEILVLIGIFFCIYLMIPFLFLSSSSLGLGLLGLLGFVGLLFYSNIHLRKLLKNDKNKQAAVFLVLIMVTIIITAYFVWTIAGPHSL